ncbi:MAG: mechanosensitive ion channel domain-containing protein [Pseudanabaena sp. ELA607]|jgi:small-conductance mechanosensitive channel
MLQNLSFTDWLVHHSQQLVDAIFKLFDAPLLTLGDYNLSLEVIAKALIDFALVFLIARVGKITFKNIILSRLGLDLGSRESLSTIVSYLLVIAGCLVSLQLLGINLSSLTVVGGALGLGIGVGLQNIANNFASGILLLFERSIKVGDFIELEDLSGIVEEISIRSATLRTNDGVSVIVPNSHFLENRVVNWSYKDHRSRIQISIDVPDYIDPLVIVECLISAARRHPDVLSSPPPAARFKGYQQGMDFYLLAWIDKPAESEEIKSDLYFLIEEELRNRHIARRDSDSLLDIQNIAHLNNVIRQFNQEKTNQERTKQEQNPADQNDHNMGDRPHDLPQMPNLAANSVESRQYGINPLKASLYNPSLVEASLSFNLSLLLKQVSYFKRCNSLELRRIIERGYQKTLDADYVICRENDPGDCFYIILSGAVEVYVDSIGKQVAIRQPGEFIGEMSLLLGTKRTATLRTLTETTLFVVDRDNLKSLLAKHKDLADSISQELCKRQDSLAKLGIHIEGNRPEPPFVQIRKHIEAWLGI